MNTVQGIRAKSSASAQKARADDDEDSEKVAPISDDAVEAVAPEHAPPPPGMGKLVDRSV